MITTINEFKQLNENNEQDGYSILLDNVDLIRDELFTYTDKIETDYADDGRKNSREGYYDLDDVEFDINPDYNIHIKDGRIREDSIHHASTRDNPSYSSGKYVIDVYDFSLHSINDDYEEIPLTKEQIDNICSKISFEYEM